MDLCRVIANEFVVGAKSLIMHGSCKVVANEFVVGAKSLNLHGTCKLLPMNL